MKFSALLLLSMALMLTALSIVGDGLKYLCGEGMTWVTGFHQQFDIENEGNIATWFASTLLLINGIMLATIGASYRRRRAPFAGHWMLLAAVFVFLSMDEAAMLHEMLIAPMRSIIPNSWRANGILRYGWIAPYLILVAVLGVSYVRFLWHLPGRTRNLIIASGVIYVGAALGLEMLEGWRLTQYPDDRGGDVVMFAMTTSEGSLELLSMVLFYYALADFGARTAQAGAWSDPYGAVPIEEAA